MKAFKVVLDANILIRAVLGTQVRALLIGHLEQTQFFAPLEAFEDARLYLPPLLVKRGRDAEQLLETLKWLEGLVTPVSPEVYTEFENRARARLMGRDEEDWPYIALAMLLDAQIWTEDTDFFGIGMPVWKTDRIHLLWED